MKYALIVLGPAGSGKSTFCSYLTQHYVNSNRNAFLFNMDPAAEAIIYNPDIDVRELLNVVEIEEGLGTGPNGGLVVSMRLLAENPVWLQEALGQAEDDFLVVDCPDLWDKWNFEGILERQNGGMLAADANEEPDLGGIYDFLNVDVDTLVMKLNKSTPDVFGSLNESIGSLLRDYSLISFVPVSVYSQSSMENVSLAIDVALQFGEDEEPKFKDYEEN